MAFVQIQDMPWHKGELAIQEAMHVPHSDNPTVPSLSPQLANHLQVAPLVAIGCLDRDGRPWTTLAGGESGLGQAIAQGIIGVRTNVVAKYDPVIEALFGKDADGEVVREEGRGRMVSGLTIDLEKRKRVKMFGRMVAGAVSTSKDEEQATVEAQLVLKIEQSLGNCPKYLNQRHIVPAKSEPSLLTTLPLLSQQALDLISNADLFFITSCGEDDMDCNHRGGPPGFLRAVQAEQTTLYWPEYSGNRLYQTLGNLNVNPRAGISIPDFDNGTMLYLTGTTEILVGKSILPKTNLAVKFTVEQARLVERALPFRGLPGDLSPYNPTVRYLTTEKKQPEIKDATMQATLLQQTIITPTISRYRFALDTAVTYKAGQYVTFDFSSLLSLGYSHMRDDDPRSINDDFVRTFTVSSPAASDTKEFEITIRHVGVATNYMSKYKGTDHEDRQRLEVDVKGFGGDFEVVQDKSEEICFIAAGVGITPLLPSLSMLDLDRVHLLWTVRQVDMPLLDEAFSRCPALASRATIFVTGADDGSHQQDSKFVQLRRRLCANDVQPYASMKTYLCTATPLRKRIMEWLPTTELIFEDFNF